MVRWSGGQDSHPCVWPRWRRTCVCVRGRTDGDVLFSHDITYINGLMSIIPRRSGGRLLYCLLIHMYTLTDHDSSPKGVHRAGGVCVSFFSTSHDRSLSLSPYAYTVIREGPQTSPIVSPARSNPRFTTRPLPPPKKTPRRQPPCVDHRGPPLVSPSTGHDSRIVPPSLPYPPTGFGGVDDDDDDDEDARSRRRRRGHTDALHERSIESFVCSCIDRHRETR